MAEGAIELGAIYADEHRRLERFLVRRGVSIGAAADLVQDAFLNMLRTPRTDVRDTRSYLFRAAGNLAIDAARSERRAGNVFTGDEFADAVADPAPLQDAVIVRREELAALRTALDDLPPRAREVLVLHKLEGLSYAEIAARLGISKNTVMAHMVKAVGTLRTRFREKSFAGN